MPAKKASKKNLAKFTIDCAQPIEDKVLDLSEFEKFLHEKIKVDGKAGNLGTRVKVTKDKSKMTIAAEMPFSKRYLKYLTKKYLKKEQLRDFLRVIANGKTGYTMKYFKTDAGEE